MKSQKTAFLLQFFLNFGFAHFYIGKNTLGTIKLCFNCIFSCYFTISMCCSSSERNYKETTIYSKASQILYIFSLLSFCVWWFVDVIYFGFNLINDEKDVSLSPW